jgi:hypothetical protein
MSSRREFVVQLSLGCAALAAGTAAKAQPAMVKETDAIATSLGYKEKASTSKDPKFKAGAACSSCALYQGKAGDASGACPLFAGKLVAAAGWCNAYAKKG